MIQDIYPHHFDNTYKLCAPKEGDKVFLLTKERKNPAGPPPVEQG